MRHLKLGIFACCASLVAAGCQRTPVDANPGPPGEPPREEPAIPAGYSKIAPAPADTPAQMLAQTATIFRGKLKEIRFAFDLCGGPRTQYVFGDASSLAGVA